MKEGLLPEVMKSRIPPLYSTEIIPVREKKVVMKYFSVMTNWSWFVLEGEACEGNDYLFFGIVRSPICTEMGYFSLNEMLECEIEIPRRGKKCMIELDKTFQPTKVKDLDLYL